MTLTEILNLKMQDNDANAETIRDYLHALLKAIWDEGEGFSGKRPFGNSGWEYELYIALVANNVVKGELEIHDGWHDLIEVDTKAANEVVFDLIYHVFYDE